MKFTDIDVKDFTNNGKCSNCGNCCSNMLPLSEREIIAIKKYIKANNIKEQRHNVMVGIDMTCPFRNETTKKCNIYEIRPQICREFMCNHKKEDIMKAKIDFHSVNKVVCMRHEFFGNKEDLEFMLFMANQMRG